MSRVLKRFNSFESWCKINITSKFNSRKSSYFTRIPSKWRTGVSFGAGCIVTASGSYIWWKTKNDFEPQTVPLLSTLYSSTNVSNGLSLCNSAVDEKNVSSGPSVEEVSTSPWLESRDPVLSRDAVKKQMNDKISAAKRHASDLCMRIKDESGSPGLVMAVSVDGKIIHEAGFGYADIENRILALPDTIMRIASISKCITMAAAGKLMEQGKLDLDKPVQHYVPHWPDKYVDGEKVTITTRHLVSHLGGVRHYDKTCTKHRKRKDQSAVLGEEKEGKTDETRIKDKKKSDIKESGNGEFEQKEYHLMKYYPSVKESLKLFQDDKLCSKPGTEFLYTTHGWTLISSVIESASGKPFTKVIKDLLKELGLEKTYLDENEPLIYKRARFYNRKVGRLVNVPYVDSSYKWGGGGILSNVRDLTRFGNAMLYSYQSDVWNAQETKTGPAGNIGHDIVKLGNVSMESDNKDNSKEKEFYKIAPNNSASGKDTQTLKRYVKPKEVFLKSSTVKEMWTPVKGTKMGWDVQAEGGGYGMGWGVVPHKPRPGTVNDQRFYVSHTGGAIGASSVLLIMPTDIEHIRSSNGGLDMQQPVVIQTQGPHPRGIVVSIMCNMQAVGLNKTAKEIAKVFANLDKSLRELEENQKNKGSSKIDKGLERC